MFFRGSCKNFSFLVHDQGAGAAGADVDSEDVLWQWTHAIRGRQSRYGVLLRIPLIRKSAELSECGTIPWRVR